MILELKNLLAARTGWLWAAMIAGVAVYSLMPGASKPEFLEHFGVPADVVMHVAVYAVLAAIPAVRFPLTLRVLLPVLVLLAVGILIEAAQTLIPNRSFTLKDIFSNTAGICIGTFIRIAIAWVVTRWNEPQEQDDAGTAAED